MLGVSQLGTILQSLRSHFRIASDAEISIESNPSSLNPEKLSSYLESGINRLSLGIQSFNDVNLKTLGRIHDSKKAIQSFETARKAGFENISIDLIYGLPGQTPARWNDDLSTAASINPNHISAYNLIIERNTIFGELYQQGKLDLPADDDQREMYYSLIDHLDDAGFERYELSNFARDGKYCRHNLKYWRDGRYLGFGPSAVSCDGQRREKNIADLKKYSEKVRSGEDILEYSETIDPEKAREERIMMGLRLTEGLSLCDYKSEFGIDLKAEKELELRLLMEKGYVTIEGDRLEISRDGLFISDEITVKLI